MERLKAFSVEKFSMHQRGLCRRAVAGWLVSVTFVYCVETAEDTAVVAMECE